MSERILSIDIGGSKIKGCVMNMEGEVLQDYTKLITPKPSDPANVMKTIEELAANFSFDKIAAGFPGYVRDGIVHTAPNLGTEAWAGIHLAEKLTSTFSKPARVINDADMLGLGVVQGNGLELMVTLGTGFGTALFLNGKLLPHLEIAHHPIKKGLTYDEYIGDAAMRDKGKEKWSERVQFCFTVLKTVFNYDKLYIGGGNSRFLQFKLEDNMVTVTNLQGIDGGAKLWKQ
ncbi:MAG: ROK family protein [Chitinophagaceae bacterium]|nr:MAG: ROK family protein [Chitinophagaceae bacterium]